MSHLLGGACAIGGVIPGLAWADRDADVSAHFPFGAVTPARAVGPWTVVTHEGRKLPLRTLLQGRTTVLHRMFTTCSSTCPIQGALIAQAQAKLAALAPRVQFLSLSVDALGDTPKSLESWLRQMRAAPGWQGAIPHIDHLDSIQAWLEKGGEVTRPGLDPHPGQIYIVDRRGQLVHRTAAMPRVGDICQIAIQIEKT